MDAAILGVTCAPADRHVSQHPDRLLGLLMEHAPGGIALFDHHMRYLAVSRRFLVEHGLPGDLDVIGRSHYDVFPHLPEDWRAAHARVLAGETLSNDEERHVRSDGSINWVRWEMCPWRTANGEIGGALLTTENRTEQVESRRLLAASEALFRSTANQVPVILWVTDPQGAYEFVNDRWRSFFGMTLGQVRELGWEVLVHPEDHPFFDTFRAASLARRPFSQRVRMRRADGEWRTLAIEGRPRLDENGHFFGTFGVSTDVTEELRAAERDREAARQKDEFIAVLAHELRNPLAPIRTACGVLRTAEASDPTVARCREIINRQVGLLTRLLDDLLDLSRLERNQLLLRRGRVRLPEVLAMAIETTRPLLDTHRHTLQEQVDEALEMDVDAVRIAQVFSNLLNNAAKYTKPGGVITLTARRVADSEGREWAQVDVADNGIGIDPTFQDQIFEMFAQGDPAGTGEGGLGIGLTLTRRLLDMHGGSVHVESAGIGLGARFVVRLPLVGPQSRALTPAGPDVVRRGTASRVLVVDDNVDAADTVGLLLEACNVEVRVAYGGREALGLAETFHPDLVLLDLGMPEMDGWTVCAALRARRWERAPRIVALTGWGQAADRLRTQTVGFDDHLVKPVDPDVLTALVDRLQDSPA